MKKIVFMTAAFAALMLTACKKEKSEQQPGTPGTPSAKVLKKITKTENGHTTVYNLTYDASRLMTIKSADNTEFTNFTYDGSGNVLKVEETEYEFKNIYTYTYNNGLPVSGTFKSWQRHAGEPDELIEDNILGYTITNNQVSKMHLNMTQADEQMDFNLTYTNGNLTKVVSDGGMFPYTATFTYGTKKAAFPKVYKYVLDQAGFSLQFFGGNDMLTEVIDLPGNSFDVNMNMQYTYDAAGYVLTSNDGTTSLKFDYQ
jgi:hypothetical protein